MDSSPVPAFGPAGLRQEVARRHDRAGHQVREERDEQHEIKQVLLRRDAPPVDIDGVTDGLEGVEGDADGQDHLEDGKRCAGAQRVDAGFHGLEEEVGVLEIEEQAKVAHDADRQEQPAPARGGQGFQASRDQVVDDGGHTDDEGQPVVPAGVEIEAGAQQQQDAPAVHAVAPRRGRSEHDGGGQTGPVGASLQGRHRGNPVRVAPARGGGGPRKALPARVAQDGGAGQD